MRILSLSIIRREPKPSKILSVEYELNHIGFLKRSSVQEVLAFLATTVAERTAPGVRQVVREEGKTGFVYAHASQPIASVMLTEGDYPQRVAFTLLTQLLDDYIQKYPTVSSYSSDFPPLGVAIKKYQEPEKADTIMKVQKELDETKVVLHETIESVLNRGEKLDNLVAQSEQLSNQSKGFYKIAKKTNSGCCWMM